MFDYLKIHADTVQLVLQPGERAVALLNVTYVAGEELVGPQHDVVDFDVVNGLTVTKWERASERLLLGTSLSARPGDAAPSLVSALGQGAPALILTTGRLLLVDEFQSDKARVVWGVPHAAVGAIRHVPQWNQRGRIGIVFRDGSWVRLVAGFVFAGKARRFVAAWEQFSRS